LEHVI